MTPTQISEVSYQVLLEILIHCDSAFVAHILMTILQFGSTTKTTADFMVYLVIQVWTVINRNILCSFKVKLSWQNLWLNADYHKNSFQLSKSGLQWTIAVEVNGANLVNVQCFNTIATRCKQYVFNMINIMPQMMSTNCKLY